MDPLITLASLSASLKLISTFAKQFSKVYPNTRAPLDDNQLAELELVDNQVAGDQLLIKKEGVVYERITPFDVERLDDQSKKLISTLEAAVTKHFERWTEIYGKIADADDPEIVELYQERLSEVCHQMCHDLDLLLGFFEKLGKRIDQHYIHLRHICTEANSAQNDSPSSWRQSMPSAKSTGIGAAIIAAIAAIVVGYLQFVYKPKPNGPPPAEPYTGRVINNDTSQAIHGAKVSLEQDRNVPVTRYTDTNGIFHFSITENPRTIKIRVDASGYEVFDQVVNLTGTGIEDVRLKPIKAPTAGSIGLTFPNNPTVDYVRHSLAMAKNVRIAYSNRTCERRSKREVVELNGAQLEGMSIKEVLDNARSRTKLKYDVRVVKEGDSYEIVCQL